MTHLLDHLLVAIITLLFPLYSWREVRKAERLLAAPDAAPFDTVADYKRTIAVLTGLGVLCLLNWGFQGRDAAVLGLGAGSTPLRWVAGIALTLVGLGVAQWQAMKLRHDASTRATLLAHLSRIAFLLPHTRRELRWFNGVALAAGVWEEILYRGFLIWYVQHWLGSVPALLVAALAFGLAHSYQGASNILQTAFIGFWLGAIFLLTGSLWPAMVAHFVFDIISGRMIHAVLSE